MLYIIMVIVFGLLLLSYMWFKAFDDHIDYRTIKLNKVDEEKLTLFFISDIHTRIIKEQTINKITSKIDIVIIGGDLLEKGVKLNKVKRNLTLLKSLGAPIYFIWGNNDFEVDPEELKQILEQNNICILKNSARNIKHGSKVVSLVGLDCCNVGEPNLELGLSKANGDLTFLLTHDPTAFYELTAKQANPFDLVLSGHTHGGQIRLLGFGLYSRGGCNYHFGTPVMVSEGYGFTKLPLRLGTRAECHVLTIGK